MELTKKLKDYLVAEEIDKLEQEIIFLRQIITDKDEIIKRMTPLIDNILNRKFLEDKEMLIQIFSEHIASILERSSNKYPTRLHQSLNKTITKNFEEEMKNNRDKMVDIMYPVLGNMVSRYVSSAINEMMETINQKIEKRLPYEQYKRKILSKISGRSEAEILFTEENNAKIEAIFIIDKKSGMLICEEHIEGNTIKDPYMVASMASAIKDFISEWIKLNKSSNTVEIISYGDAVLYMEDAGTVYLIAFLNQMPKENLKTKIGKLFASILSQHSNSFQNFSGDDQEMFLQEVKTVLKKFLVPKKKEKNSIIKTKSIKERWKDNPTVKKYSYILMAIVAIFWIFLGSSDKINLPKSNALTSYFKNSYEDTYLESEDEKFNYNQNIWLEKKENSLNSDSLHKIKGMLDFLHNQKNISIEITYFDDKNKEFLLKLVNLLKKKGIKEISYHKDKKQETNSFMLKYKLFLTSNVK